MNQNLNTDEYALDRLTHLGIPFTALTEAIKQGYYARARTTENHPAISRGVAMWGEVVAALREQLIPNGWTKSDKNNYSIIKNDEARLIIAVTTGDEATGLKHLQPTNKSPKGMNTISAVETNYQLDMFSEYLPEQQTQDFTTWILLVHLAKNEVRSELSLPTSIAENGKINGWIERIILPPFSLEDDMVEISPPEIPDVEVPIKKKA